eukprot:gene11826-64543_t
MIHHEEEKMPKKKEEKRPKRKAEKGMKQPRLRHWVAGFAAAWAAAHPHRIRVTVPGGWSTTFAATSEFWDDANAALALVARPGGGPPRSVLWHRGTGGVCIGDDGYGGGVRLGELRRDAAGRQAARGARGAPSVVAGLVVHGA